MGNSSSDGKTRKRGAPDQQQRTSPIQQDIRHIPDDKNKPQSKQVNVQPGNYIEISRKKKKSSHSQIHGIAGLSTRNEERNDEMLSASRDYEKSPAGHESIENTSQTPMDNINRPFGDNINGLLGDKTLPPLKNKDKKVTKEKKKKKKRKDNSIGHLEPNVPDDIENFHHQIEKLKFELQQKDKQIDQLTNRLSAIASAKLRDNNPDIADLSDQNRPTKLAEKFSELYDNEWTAAFADIEETHKNMNEKKIVDLLLKSIKEVYQQCVEVSEKDMNDLKTQIAFFTGIKERFGDVCQMKYMDIPTVQAYITASIELCWLMCVQDPPVFMYTNCTKGDSFDEKIFKGYTKSSYTVEFLVWPALYLHENGQLLSKGVAQGTPRKKRSFTQGRIDKVSVPLSDQNKVNTNLLSLSLTSSKLSEKGTCTSDREDETASSVDQLGSNPGQIVSETHDVQSERMSDCRIAELAMKSQLQKTKSYKGGDAATTMQEDVPGVATG